MPTRGRVLAARRPEVNLLGIAYSHGGFQSAAPYRVIDASHWVFAGTGLKQGDLFGLQNLHERCPGGASGHELDKITDDSPKDLIHLAKGTNADDSGADMIIFDTPGGGQVFSVGSMCWTLSIPIDDGISTLTANVLRKFSEQSREEKGLGTGVWGLGQKHLSLPSP